VKLIIGRKATPANFKLPHEEISTPTRFESKNFERSDSFVNYNKLQPICMILMGEQF